MQSESFDLTTYTTKSKSAVDYKFNEICNLIDHPAHADKCILLVEGADDLDLYFKFFDPLQVKICISNGKGFLEELFTRLKEKDYLFFAIRDADFSRLDNEKIGDENFFLTDCHDLEMMCFKHIKSQQSFFENNAVPYDPNVILSVFSQLKVLSYLRWFNLHQDLGLNFNAFSPAGKRLEDLQSVRYLIEATLLDKKKKLLMEGCIEDVISAYHAFTSSKNNADNYEVTNGHDFISKLSEELKTRSSSQHIHNYRLNVFVKCLLTGFTFDLFKETRMYAQIKDWSNAVGRSLFADNK